MKIQYSVALYSVKESRVWLFSLRVIEMMWHDRTILLKRHFEVEKLRSELCGSWKYLKERQTQRENNQELPSPAQWARIVLILG